MIVELDEIFIPDENMVVPERMKFQVTIWNGFEYHVSYFETMQGAINRRDTYLLENAKDLQIAGDPVLMRVVISQVMDVQDEMV